jgi:hypothetical protein
MEVDDDDNLRSLDMLVMKKGSQIGHKSVTDTMCTDAICTAVVMA